MKSRIAVFTSAALLLTACTSMRKSIEVQSFLPQELTLSFQLGEIRIPPELQEFHSVLPDLIKSVAQKHNIQVHTETADPLMDVFLLRKSFLSNFRHYESVILMLSIRRGDKEIAAAFLTRDSVIPIESFASIYEIFDMLMPALGKEYQRIQEN